MLCISASTAVIELNVFTHIHQKNMCPTRTGGGRGYSLLDFSVFIFCFDIWMWLNALVLVSCDNTQSDPVWLIPPTAEYLYMPMESMPETRTLNIHTKLHFIFDRIADDYKLAIGICDSKSFFFFDWFIYLISFSHQNRSKPLALVWYLAKFLN